MYVVIMYIFYIVFEGLYYVNDVINGNLSCFSICYIIYYRFINFKV